jgi:hypothetical protein
MSRIHVLLCCVAGVATFSCGCGGGAGSVKTVAAGGTVTLQGAPLAGASVTFIPDDGPVATGVTDLKGKFTLATGTQAGAVLGKSRVSVNLPAQAEDDLGNLTPAEKSMELTRRMGKNPGKMFHERDKKSAIPEKYTRADSSGLEFNVISDPEKNQFKIDL